MYKVLWIRVIFPFINKSQKRNNEKNTTRNIFLRNRTEENKRMYSKQRNYCVSLKTKTKRDYYGNLDIKKLPRIRDFGKQ